MERSLYGYVFSLFHKKPEQNVTTYQKCRYNYFQSVNDCKLQLQSNHNTWIKWNKINLWKIMLLGVMFSYGRHIRSQRVLSFLPTGLLKCSLDSEQTFFAHIWVVCSGTFASPPSSMSIVTTHFSANVISWSRFSVGPKSKLANRGTVCPNKTSWWLMAQTDPSVKRLMKTKTEDKIVYITTADLSKISIKVFTKVSCISPSSLTVEELIARWHVFVPSLFTDCGNKGLR